ncbi:MAG: hypothetical protein U9O55_02620 [Patescibacteria group bacterium]|nr:hypothetical protein [Patescibacteria group bacterium]
MNNKRNEKLECDHWLNSWWAEIIISLIIIYSVVINIFQVIY